MVSRLDLWIMRIDFHFLCLGYYLFTLLCFPGISVYEYMHLYHYSPSMAFGFSHRTSMIR